MIFLFPPYSPGCMLLFYKINIPASPGLPWPPPASPALPRPKLSRAEPSQPEKSQAGPGRARWSRAETGRAEPSPSHDEIELVEDLGVNFAGNCGIGDRWRCAAIESDLGTPDVMGEWLDLAVTGDGQPVVV